MPANRTTFKALIRLAGWPLVGEIALRGGEARAVDDAMERTGECDGALDFGLAGDAALDTGCSGGLKIENDWTGASGGQRGGGGGSQSRSAAGEENGFTGDLHGWFRLASLQRFAILIVIDKILEFVLAERLAGPVA
mgnify:CR=1 FL=1